MGTDASNVRVGFDGALYYAPKSDTLVLPGPPVGTIAAGKGDKGEDAALVKAAPTIPAEFKDVGFLSSDGLTFARNTDYSEVKAWQKSTVVRKSLTSADLTLQFTMIETRPEALELFFGVAGTKGGTAPAEYLELRETAPTPKRWAIALDVIDGDGIYRCIVPNAEVTEQGEVQINENETGLQVTVTAYPYNAEGVKAIHYWVGVDLSAL